MCAPEAIRGQPSSCAGVGPSKVLSNQERVAGLKTESASIAPSVASETIPTLADSAPMFSGPPTSTTGTSAGTAPAWHARCATPPASARAWKASSTWAAGPVPSSSPSPSSSARRTWRSRPVRAVRRGGAREGAGRAADGGGRRVAPVRGRHVRRDVVAASSNFLSDPEGGLREMARVTHARVASSRAASGTTAGE